MSAGQKIGIVISFGIGFVIVLLLVRMYRPRGHR